MDHGRAILHVIACISISLCVLINIMSMVSLLFEARLLKDSALQKIPEAFVHLPKTAAMYKDYLKKFNKNYSNLEMRTRFEYFKESLKEINRLNQETGAFHGLTKFSDLSKEELFGARNATKKYLLSDVRGDGLGLSFRAGRKLRSCRIMDRFCMDDAVKSIYSDDICAKRYNDNVLPVKFDWRERGVVRSVLDQKYCNGCWAFSIAGVMESMAAIQGIERDVMRSIQELIDCSEDNDGHHGGCAGDNVVQALSWLCDARWGVVTEEEYPLVLVTDTCSLHSNPEGRRVKQFCQQCLEDNETHILRLIAFHGPVMAVVNAEPWRNYIDGVIQRSCFRSHDGATLDHVVQIVGYDTTADVPHYIIRNSWGEDFGDRGYLKLAIGGNLCGVAEEISFFNVY